MVVDYKRYLAENVLSERRTVTYRLLSRALKVHSNLAKQMLYEFHRTENAKIPQTVNATYIITGLQRPPEKPAINGMKKDGDDEVMQSSPFMSSMPHPDDTEQPIRTTSFLLAREEDLAEVKATFEFISSTHIYSIQPNILQDLNVLRNVGREIVATYGNEDPLESSKQWGMIQNDHVKRRKGVRPPPSAVPSATKAAPEKPSVFDKQTSKKEESSQPKNDSESEAATSKPSSQKSTSASQSKSTNKTIAPTQRRKSNLFTSFAKAKPKLKTEDLTPALSGAESAEPSAAEDAMFDDDDEEEREDLFLDTGERKSNKSRESRKERVEKLKRMMDDNDEDMPDAPEAAEQLAPGESKSVEPENKPEPKEEITVSGGRRRGRRQVMKKKMVKDEEGYLVTIEELAWESFSEDEPAPPPKKKPAVSVPAASKGKKTGQGNIMSFFSKK